MRTLEAGWLLVATPALRDSVFDSTVVLLIDVDTPDADGNSHDGGGAVGVVLNRPSGVPVADVLSAWSDLVDDPEVLFQGGPVGADGALALGRLRPGTEPPVGFRPVGDAAQLGDIGVVDLDAPVEFLGAALGRLRIFAGYAGWARGQLEREIDEGSWYVVPGAEIDLFRSEVTTLWRDVLRRQPGELAWNATRPADAGLN